MINGTTQDAIDLITEYMKRNNNINDEILLRVDKLEKKFNLFEKIIELRMKYAENTLKQIQPVIDMNTPISGADILDYSKSKKHKTSRVGE